MSKTFYFSKSNKDLDYIVKILIANKALLFLISIIAILFLPIGAGFQKNIDGIFLNSWAQWDGKAYLTIAEGGYVQLEDGRVLYNFLPFYPFLIKSFGFVFSLPLAAFLISNIASFLFCFYLYRLTKLEFGEKISKKTVFFILFFPTAFFFSAVYTESLFLFLIVASFYYSRRGEWIKAGIISIFLPITRVVGFLIFLPLIIEYFHQKNFKLKLDYKFLFTLFPLIGVAIVFLFYSFTSSGGYLEQKNLWSRYLSSPHLAILNTLEIISGGNIWLTFYGLWNLFMIGGFIFLLYYAIKIRFRVSYIAYMLISFGLPILSSTLEGISRFVLVSFPVFILLAIFSCGSKQRNIIIKCLYVVFLIMLIVLTARFNIGSVGVLI